MPPPPNRFPTGPTTISPYQHQFPPHGQGHAGGHPPPLGNPAYINPNAQLNPFAANGALSLAAGLNAASGFGAHDASGLGSHAARLGFSQGATLQQHHQQQQQQHHPQQSHGVMVDHPTRNQTKGRIREVWKHNLHEEMAVLRDLIERYSYISMVRFECFQVAAVDTSKGEKRSARRSYLDRKTDINLCSASGHNVPRRGLQANGIFQI